MPAKLAVLLLSLASSPLPAIANQESTGDVSLIQEMKPIAAAMADSLKIKFQRTPPQVLIWPCIEPGEVFSEFANRFPKELSPLLLAALDEVSDFKGRARVDSGYVSGPHAPGSRSESSAVLTAASGTYNALIWARCESGRKGVYIQLKLLEVPTQRKLKSFVTKIRLTPELAAMLKRPADPAPQELPVPLEQHPREIKEGIPVCTYCPNPVNDCTPVKKNARVILRIIHNGGGPGRKHQCDQGRERLPEPSRRRGCTELEVHPGGTRRQAGGGMDDHRDQFQAVLKSFILDDAAE